MIVRERTNTPNRPLETEELFYPTYTKLTLPVFFSHLRSPASRLACVFWLLAAADLSNV